MAAVHWRALCRKPLFEYFTSLKCLEVQTQMFHGNVVGSCAWIGQYNIHRRQRSLAPLWPSTCALELDMLRLLLLQFTAIIQSREASTLFHPDINVRDCSRVLSCCYSTVCAQTADQLLGCKSAASFKPICRYHTAQAQAAAAALDQP
jgi:hypothetical protein